MSGKLRPGITPEHERDSKYPSRRLLARASVMKVKSATPEGQALRRAGLRTPENLVGKRMPQGHPSGRPRRSSTNLNIKRCDTLDRTDQPGKGFLTEHPPDPKILHGEGGPPGPGCPTIFLGVSTAPPWIPPVTVTHTSLPRVSDQRWIWEWTLSIPIWRLNRPAHHHTLSIKENSNPGRFTTRPRRPQGKLP